MEARTPAPSNSWRLFGRYAPCLWATFVTLSVLGHLGVFVFCVIYHRTGWFVTLATLSFLGLLALAVTHRSGRQARLLASSSFDCILYWMPWTFLCLYGFFIIHKGKHMECSWFIHVGFKQVQTDVIRVAMFGVSCLGLIAMARAAWRIDCRANRRYAHRVTGICGHTFSHVLLRFSEVAFRGLGAILFCEFLHITQGPAVECLRKYSPLEFFLPFCTLVLCYCVVLYWSNAPVERQWRDDPFAVFVVALSTLCMNPVLFLDRVSCMEAAGKARQRIQILHALELAVLLLLTWSTSLEHFPPARCSPRLDDIIVGDWFLRYRPALPWFAGLLAVVHYGLRQFSPEIKTVLQQINAADANLAVGEVSHDFTAELAGPATGYGMCRTLVQVAGSGIVDAFVSAAELDSITHYRLLQVLGAGGFGVVVLTDRESGLADRGGEEAGVADGRPLFAMKLLSLAPRPHIVRLDGQRRPDELAQREREAYQKIWQQHEALSLASGARAGHPFIVRLHFFCSWPEGRSFRIQGDGGVFQQVVLNDQSVFHQALVMEYCESGSLEAYCKRAFQHSSPGTLDDFQTVRRFLAEIVLALDFLHSVKRVVYRDLKLDNILVVNKPQFDGAHVKLGDFGYSRVMGSFPVQADSAGWPLELEAGAVSVAGSSYWMAPEMLDQCLGCGPLEVDFRGQCKLDIFSLGMAAFALGHGHPYLPGMAIMGTVRPVCENRQSRGGACRCDGCRTLRRLEDRFPSAVGERALGTATSDGGSCILELARRCLANDYAMRPTAQELRRYSLFSHGFGGHGPVDFEELLGMDI